MGHTPKILTFDLTREIIKTKQTKKHKYAKKQLGIWISTSQHRKPSYKYKRLHVRIDGGLISSNDVNTTTFDGALYITLHQQPI